MSKGQYLERPVLIAVGGLCLEGLFHRGEVAPPVLILPPHPQLGGSMDSPVVAEIAWALTRAGHPTLRLNYRGIGASQGAWEGGRHDLADVDVAVDHLRESVAPRSGSSVALLGYSYGSVLALKAAAGSGAQPLAPTLVLVAPPVLRFELGPAIARLADRGGAPTKVITIGGSDDAFAPTSEVAVAFAALGERHRGVEIAGANHVFRSGLSALGLAAVEAFERDTPDEGAIRADRG